MYLHSKQKGKTKFSNYKFDGVLTITGKVRITKITIAILANDPNIHSPPQEIINHVNT